jgi:hypothetical protein
LICTKISPDYQRDTNETILRTFFTYKNVKHMFCVTFKVLPFTKAKRERKKKEEKRKKKRKKEKENNKQRKKKEKFTSFIGWLGWTNIGRKICNSPLNQRRPIQRIISLLSLISLALFLPTSFSFHPPAVLIVRTVVECFSRKTTLQRRISYRFPCPMVLQVKQLYLDCVTINLNIAGCSNFLV